MSEPGAVALARVGHAEQLEEDRWLQRHDAVGRTALKATARERAEPVVAPETLRSGLDVHHPIDDMVDVQTFTHRAPFDRPAARARAYSVAFVQTRRARWHDPLEQ